MAKPIFIIRIPDNDAIIDDFLKKIPYNVDIISIKNEYHAFFIIDNETTNFKFEMYSPLTSEPIEFEELKLKLEKSLENHKLN